jgi:hypothetical protein
LNRGGRRFEIFGDNNNKPFHILSKMPKRRKRSRSLPPLPPSTIRTVDDLANDLANDLGHSAANSMRVTPAISTAELVRHAVLEQTPEHPTVTEIERFYSNLPIRSNDKPSTTLWIPFFASIESITVDRAPIIQNLFGRLTIDDMLPLPSNTCRAISALVKYETIGAHDACSKVYIRSTCTGQLTRCYKTARDALFLLLYIRCYLAESNRCEHCLCGFANGLLHVGLVLHRDLRSPAHQALIDNLAQLMAPFLGYKAQPCSLRDMIMCTRFLGVPLKTIKASVKCDSTVTAWSLLGLGVNSADYRPGFASCDFEIAVDHLAGRLPRAKKQQQQENVDRLAAEILDVHWLPIRVVCFWIKASPAIRHVDDTVTDRIYADIQDVHPRLCHKQIVERIEESSQGAGSLRREMNF